MPEPGERLRCPKCDKLLAVAHLPPEAWLECVCKSCKLAVIFTPDAAPVILPRYSDQAETAQWPAQ